VVTGGKEGILASQAMKKLGDKVSEMRKGLDRQAKNLGILAHLKNELQDISRRINEVGDEVSKVEVRKIKLMEVNEQLARVKEQYENVKALLDNNEKLKKIEESINGLRQKYGDVKKRLDGISALMTKLKEANEALSSIEGFEDELQVLEFRRRLNEIQIRRKDIENSLNKLQREVAEAEERLNKRKSLRFLSLRGSLVIAAIISIGGIIGTLIGPLYFLSLLILGMAFLAAGMWARSVLASKRTEISEWTGRLQRMNKTLGELGEEEMRILGEAKCSTIDEYDKKEKDFKYRLEEKGSLEAQLKGMLGDNKTVEDFQKQETEIATDLAVEKAGLTDDLKATALNPEKHIEKKREFQNLDAEKNRLEREKMECEITIKQAGSNIEDQIRLEEELKEFKEALEQEEKKVKIYELARDFISKARDEALSSITGILKDGIQTYFEIFTSGKYKQVEIRKDDKGDLEFWIRSDEKAGLAKPEELSGGVIDEFYLACRLALVKLIFGDKKPPLLLDDPFGNFDSVRLADTLSFLKTLANDYQIIIFTLGDSYDKIADNIILLGESVKPPTPDGR
jgi:DNA repair exonuclease SbcCD ATPase subunit